MTGASDLGSSWQAKVDGRERLSVHGLMKQGNALAKYLGTSVHVHLGEQGALQAEDSDREIVLGAGMLVHAMASERQNILANDTNPRFRCDASAAEEWLKDRIMTHFRCDSAFASSPPKYWDFKKQEFTATTDTFATNLDRDIRQFKRNVRAYLDKQQGYALGGVGGAK